MSDGGRILVTHPLVQGGLDLLHQHHRVVQLQGTEPRSAVLERVGRFDALLPLLTVAVDEELLAAASPRLRVVANYAVGFDNVDVPAATRRGVLVTNTPGVLTEATADLTWALILGIARRLVEGDRFMRAGQYDGWGPLLLLGADVAGKTLGIVGLGQIGRAVARRAAGFDMRILFHDTGAQGEVDLGLTRAHGVSLEQLLGEADFVTIHTPLTEQTRHLIDAERLGLMKPTAHLINTARGPIVDEAALVSCLQRGGIAGAALDVFEREPAMAQGLADLDNVLVLPHLGSATVGARAGMARAAAANAHAVLSGRMPPNLVNPEALERYPHELVG